ncbi:unnamed protein product [Brassica napus]|uniref:(rape) hypothetical protein n=1 Tax=Brassica napus TaxID=3708 RepID=A0A816JF58_BRANA|nr:unnamed protein product [Brassica napus]
MKSPIQAVWSWARRQPTKVGAFLAIAGMAALVLLRFIVHDHDNLFVAGEAVHSIRICAGADVNCPRMCKSSFKRNGMTGVSLSAINKELSNTTVILRSFNQYISFSLSFTTKTKISGNYLIILAEGLWPSMVLISEIVQTFILADFYYYYVKSVFGGQLALLLPSGVVKNVKKGRKLMGLDMFLLDEKVVVSVSETNPLIIYLRNVEKLLESERFYNLYQILLNKISEVGEEVSALFPYNIEIRPHEDESQLSSWKNRLEDDMKMVQFQDNKNQTLACHNKYESYRSEPKIVVATSINPTLLIASRNVFRRKNASLMFNKGRWSCFRLTRTAKHLFMSWLNYALKKLADDKTTKDYNIERGSVLHLVLALSGGVDVLWIVTLSYFCLGILFFL